MVVASVMDEATVPFVAAGVDQRSQDWQAASAALHVAQFSLRCCTNVPRARIRHTAVTTCPCSRSAFIVPELVRPTPDSGICSLSTVLPVLLISALVPRLLSFQGGYDTGKYRQQGLVKNCGGW